MTTKTYYILLIIIVLGLYFAKRYIPKTKFPKTKYFLLSIIIVAGGYFAVDGYISKNNIPTAKDLTTIADADIQKGVYVKSDVNFTLGYYCEETTTFSGVTTKQRYYLIPYGADRSKYIGIKVSGSDLNEFQKLENSSISYFIGEGQEPDSIGTFCGKLKKCDSEEAKYLKEFFTDFDSQNPEQFYIPYYFQMVTEEGAKNLMMIGVAMFSAGLAILIVLVFVDVKARKNTVYGGQDNYGFPASDTYGGQTGPNTVGGQFDDLVIPPPGQDNRGDFL